MLPTYSRVYVTVGCPSVCLPVLSIAAAFRVRIHICRQRQSAAASGQRQMCDPRRIDARKLVRSASSLRFTHCCTVILPASSTYTLLISSCCCCCCCWWRCCCGDGIISVLTERPRALCGTTGAIWRCVAAYCVVCPSPARLSRRWAPQIVSTNACLKRCDMTL